MADLEALYRRQVGAAIQTAWLVSRDQDTAAELVQEAFVRCAGRVGGIRDLTGFGRYWQQAVLSVASNQARREGYERRLLGRLTQSAHREDDVPDVALRSGVRVALGDALATLPERQRAVMVARFYLDMSEAATADLLGMRIGTVKSATSRALAALRAVIGTEITT
jgi:RNA polymerase sigma factor (sigma-70 family)